MMGSGAGFASLPFAGLPTAGGPQPPPAPPVPGPGVAAPGMPMDLAAIGGLPTGPQGTKWTGTPAYQKNYDALKGIKAPAAPQQQRISSPNAPRPTGHIQQGGLAALLQQLLGERAQPQQYRLGQALGGIR